MNTDTQRLNALEAALRRPTPAGENSAAPKVRMGGYIDAVFAEDETLRDVCDMLIDEARRRPDLFPERMAALAGAS